MASNSINEEEAHPTLSPTPRKTVYTGTFIHTPTLGALTVLEDAAVGVEEGVIRFVEEGLDFGSGEASGLKRRVEAWGWVWGEGEWVDGNRGDGKGRGWWFPGFVGK